METEPKIYPVANEKRSGTGVEKEKENPLIVDIKLNPATLEAWEKKGLSEEVGDLVLGFEDLVPQGEKFVFHTANFGSTSRFMEKAKNDFDKLGGKNIEVKIKEVEDFVRKAILNFAFKELEFDVENPEIAKTEEVEVYPVKPSETGAAEQPFNGEEVAGEKRKLIVKYFKTNQPDMFLVFDGIDWWLEK